MYLSLLQNQRGGVPHAVPGRGERLAHPPCRPAPSVDWPVARLVAGRLVAATVVQLSVGEIVPPPERAFFIREMTELRPVPVSGFWEPEENAINLWPPGLKVLVCDMNTWNLWCSGSRFACKEVCGRVDLTRAWLTFLRKRCLASD